MPGPSLRKLSDQDVVAQALGGSSPAYQELLRRFERPVMSLIVRMVRHPDVAEDLAQETFVKAFRHLGRYEPGRKFASWIFKIAHNTTLDYLRKKKLDTVPLDATDEEGDSWEVLAAPSTGSPQRRVESRELIAGLDAALGDLPPHYREVLLLRFREGLAYHEIADVTGQPMGTVKIHLHRARKALAKKLGERGLV